MESARIAPFGRDFEKDIEGAMQLGGVTSTVADHGLVERQRRACARLAETADAVEMLATRLLGTVSQPSAAPQFPEAHSCGVFAALVEGSTQVEIYCRRITDDLARIHAAIEGR